MARLAHERPDHVVQQDQHRRCGRSAREISVDPPQTVPVTSGATPIDTAASGPGSATSTWGVTPSIRTSRPGPTGGRGRVCQFVEVRQYIQECAREVTS
jgi:hypothetical protein